MVGATLYQSDMGLKSRKSDYFGTLWRERHLLNKPFYFQGTNGHAVLLVHGWTSTSFELRKLGQYLHEKGYTVYAPLLSGHGTVPKDLENIGWNDWYRDTETAFEKLTRDHKSVFVGGSSMGGNLSLLLCQRRKDVAGLILLATPVFLRNEKMGHSILKVFALFRSYKKKHYPPTSEGAHATTRVTAYPIYPVESAFEAYDLIRESRKNIASITQPCFMAQSRHDHLVVPVSLDHLYRNIASQYKEKMYIDNAYHTFVADPDKKYVHEAIANFVSEHTK